MKKSPRKKSQEKSSKGFFCVTNFKPKNKHKKMTEKFLFLHLFVLALSLATKTEKKSLNKKNENLQEECRTRGGGEESGKTSG